MSKVGIVIGRFQVAELTAGHLNLIDHALELNDYVIVFIGVSPARLTFKNPLSFEVRKKMILDRYDYKNCSFDLIDVLPLPDFKSDGVWSATLDHMIEEGSITCAEPKITIYSGRDGFQDYYYGKYKVEPANFGINDVCATDLRSKIHATIKNTPDWREGVIYASEHRYPVSYQAVDIAVCNFDTNEVLLGRKPHEEKFRFIGGFVDPSDESLEAAARREVSEEAEGMETSNYTYLGSFRIDDWRFRKEKDKIMTAFFTCGYNFGHPKAADDIAELKWVKIDELNTAMVEPEHVALVDKFLKTK